LRVATSWMVWEGLGWSPGCAQIPAAQRRQRMWPP
jgi:hypothetical protein